MKPINTSRLQALRLANDAAGYDQQARAGRFATMAGRHDNGTAPRAVVAHQLFQTPPELAARLASMLNLQPGARILEPSAGLGRLLDAVAPYAPREVVAIEHAPQCAAELFRQNRENVTLLQRDFLTVEPQELGYFDAVIMNPPFTMRSDIRHIEHARDFLRPGGVLAALCMAGPHREARLRPEASEWHPIEAGEFASEGTRIATVLCLFPSHYTNPTIGN